MKFNSSIRSILLPIILLGILIGCKEYFHEPLMVFLFILGLISSINMLATAFRNRHPFVRCVEKISFYPLGVVHWLLGPFFQISSFLIFSFFWATTTLLLLQAPQALFFFNVYPSSGLGFMWATIFLLSLTSHLIFGFWLYQFLSRPYYDESETNPFRKFICGKRITDRHQFVKKHIQIGKMFCATVAFIGLLYPQSHLLIGFFAAYAMIEAFQDYLVKVALD